MATLKETRERERLEMQQTQAANDAGCCETTSVPTTLMEQIRCEKACVSRKLRDRIRELDQAERMLMNSDAEQIITDAQHTLYKEN
jgi:hypothetical protein